MENYDFCGYATRNDLKCSDGRVIRRDAFKSCDGKTVPLMWSHQHTNVGNVLGHALLENREDGVYAYGKFNDSAAGKQARSAVNNGDITAMSIYANHLTQDGPNVMHGIIREVSLVMAGANPGASIDTVIRHGESYDDEAVIYTGENISISHAEEEEEKKEEKKMDNEPKKTEENEEETVQDVIDSMNEKQKNVMYAMIGEALKHEDADDDDDDDEKYEEEDEMKHNVFDNEHDEVITGDVISHEDQVAVINEAKRCGSMREACLAHGLPDVTYGIKDINYLFPDHKNVQNVPDFIQRDMGWVGEVMGSIHHIPFSRIKSTHADITADEARARGYIKGKLKKEEVFSLLKRTTDPQTIYKKQKLDRDDIIDITSFDVVAWIKAEMRMMLDEEIARAVLIGDGRLSESDEKIKEDHIRPVWTDSELYTIHAVMDTDKTTVTGADAAEDFIDTVIRSRKQYKGSGNPVLYATEDMVTECLLLKDKIGHRLYKSMDELATTLRVRKIVTVPVMEGLSRTAAELESAKVWLHGLIVNLNDYAVGADKGGAVNMFDDFDIDYNQYKYLIETRCSGALTVPKSAIAIEQRDIAAA